MIRHISAVTSLLLLAVVETSAQSVSSRVTGAVGGVTGAASVGVSAGASGGSSTVTGATNPFGPGSFDYGNGSNVGGELPGGMGVRMGDKTVVIRGAVGVGDDRGAFKAGAGIPF
jgi:hypothetical protein